MLRLILVSFLFCPVISFHPLLLLNSLSQPTWQAGQPIDVNINFDVPSYGDVDLLEELRRASSVEYEIEQRKMLLNKQRSVGKLTSLSKDKHPISLLEVHSAPHTKRSTSLPGDSSEEQLAHLRNLLAKQCGEQCVQIWNAVLASPAVRNASGTEAMWGSALLELANGVKEQADESMELMAQVAHGNLKSEVSASVAGIVGPNVACHGSASCKLKSLLANKCSIKRSALQSTYQALNVAVQILGIVTSLLCGCVNVGPVATCVLGNVPAVCGFPYSAYSSAFSQSVSLWEAVKAATKKCMVHGTSSISS